LKISTGEAMSEELIARSKTVEDSLNISQLELQANQLDWTSTINNLLKLAKDANQAFEYDRAVNYLSTLEEIWDTKDLPEFSLDLRIELYQEKGKAFASQGKHENAINEYKKILEYCRETRHLAVRSETFNQIGQLLAKQGDYDRALGYLQRAIGAYRRLEDSIGTCKALRNLGVIYLELGEFEEAEINYHEAIDIAKISGNEILYADLINNLGAIMNMKGNWRKALEYYRESLNIYKSNDEIRKSAYTKNNLAITLSEQGLHEQAFEYFLKAYSIASDINDTSLLLIVNINLADLYLKKDNPHKARYHCSHAEKYLKENNTINGHLVETQMISGKIYRFEGELEAAMDCFNNALENSCQIGAKFLEAEVLLERGALYRTIKEPFDALTDLETSYHIYTSLKADGKKEEAEKVIHSIEKLYLEIFDALARDVDRKDRYTKGHSDRVASLSLLLAKELGLKTNMLKSIVAAALLHDIGKIKIDDNILKKAGKLTEQEFDAIKRHPELGVELLRGKEFPWEIKEIILSHHEKINGTGYPLGLKGEDIPLGGRIICIADVFDALTSDRIYRKAYRVEKTLSIMKEDAGTAFDPVILNSFVRLIVNGKADMIINSKTDEDELFSIWSQCHDADDENEKNDKLEKLVF